MSVALVRYLAADALRGQRWVAPLLAFLGGVAIFNVSAGPLLTTYADSAAVLLPVAMWVIVSVANSEDPVQAGITAVAVGGDLRLRAAKLLTAWLGCAGLAAVALVWPLAVHSYSGRATAGDVAAGLAALLLVALFGVAVGGFGMRAVLPRAGATVVFAAAVALADLLIPHAPPTRRILELFDQGRVAGLAGVAVETAALAAALVTVSLVVARRRS